MISRNVMNKIKSKAGDKARSALSVLLAGVMLLSTATPSFAAGVEVINYDGTDESIPIEDITRADEQTEHERTLSLTVKDDFSVEVTLDREDKGVPEKAELAVAELLPAPEETEAEEPAEEPAAEPAAESDSEPDDEAIPDETAEQTQEQTGEQTPAAEPAQQGDASAQTGGEQTAGPDADETAGEEKPSAVEYEYEYDEYVRLAAEELELKKEDVTYARLFDISLIDTEKGEAVEPEKDVKVSITIEKLEQENPKTRFEIVHFTKDEKD